jgi:hypothetical protein
LHIGTKGIFRANALCSVQMSFVAYWNKGHFPCKCPLFRANALCALHTGTKGIARKMPFVPVCKATKIVFRVVKYFFAIIDEKETGENEVNEVSDK